LGLTGPGRSRGRVVSRAPQYLSHQSVTGILKVRLVRNYWAGHMSGSEDSREPHDDGAGQPSVTPRQKAPLGRLNAGASTLINLTRRIKRQPVVIVVGAVVAAVVVVVVALGNLADSTSKINETTHSDKEKEQSTAIDDADLFAIKGEVIGDECAKEFGWSELPEASPPREHDWNAVAATRKLGFLGGTTVRLKFNLPKRADATSIEISQLDVEAKPGRSGRPAWGLSHGIGCGGGAVYHELHLASVQRGKVQLQRLDEMTYEPLRDARFRPFTVDAGDWPQLDVGLVLCDRANYDVRVRVAYASDAGTEGVRFFPSDGYLHIAGVAPRALYGPPESYDPNGPSIVRLRPRAGEPLDAWAYIGCPSFAR
jgi:hypothetical protein